MFHNQVQSLFQFPSYSTSSSVPAREVSSSSRMTAVTLRVLTMNDCGLGKDDVKFEATIYVKAWTYIERM